MNEKNINFINKNSKILGEIFGEKISLVMIEILDSEEKRSERIEAVNIIRNWLREINVIGNELDKNSNSFI